MSLERALDLAAQAAGRAYPKPTVGAVVVRDGVVVGEGATETGGRHAEIVALDAAGERARDATLFATMEPCAHWGTTPPCVDRIIAEGVTKVVIGSRDPNPEASGGLEKLVEAGVEVEVVDSWPAHGQNEAWRTWVAKRRPFVIYKAAVSLDGRVVVPGQRWVETPRGQPRRLAVGRGPLPEGAELELRPGGLAEELGALAAEGVQSLLLEGGPTLAGGFFEADLVDKLILFVAPVLAGGDGPAFLPRLPSSRRLGHLRVEPVGDDVLLEAYVHET